MDGMAATDPPAMNAGIAETDVLANIRATTAEVGAMNVLRSRWSSFFEVHESN
jgi:hypothetical protein